MINDSIEFSNKEFLEIIPFGIAIVDKDNIIVNSNKLFKRIFRIQETKDKVYISDYVSFKELNFNIREIIESGKENVSYKTGTDGKGRSNYHVIQFVPLKGKTGKNEFVACMVNDISATNHWQKEFNILFEKVPCYISIIDRKYQVVRANEKFRETFGDITISPTVEIYKKKTLEIENSPTVMSFMDGGEYMANQVALSKTGEKTYFVVTTTPIAYSGDKVSLVMEIAYDITEITQLQDQLRHAHDFYSNLIENSADAIVATGTRNKTQIFNQAARLLFDWDNTRKPGIPKIMEMMPEQFFGEPNDEGIIINNSELSVTDSHGHKVPVRMNAYELRNKKSHMGRVAFMQDLRPIKRLEAQKQFAEEKALQTTFRALEKNVMKLIEDSEIALKNYEDSFANDNQEDSCRNWRLLKQKLLNNNEITRTFVKLAKDYSPDTGLFDLKKAAEGETESFEGFAKDLNIRLQLNLYGELEEVKSDEAALRSILKILIANGLEAASKSERSDKRVSVKVAKNRNELFIEVYDNGIYFDDEKLKNFFRLDANSDARIGMLTVNMLVKALKGKIEIDSREGHGTRYVILMPESA